MRRFELIFTTVAFLFLGTAAPAFAVRAQQQQQGQQTQQRKTRQAEKQKKQPPQANRPAPQGQRSARQPAPQQQPRAQRPQNNRPAPRGQRPRTQQPPTQQRQPRATRPARPAQRPAQPARRPAQQRSPQQRAPQQRPGTQRPQPRPRTTQPRTPRQRIPAADQGRIWQQHRARNWQTDHRTWRQRGGYTGYRIPQNRFRLSFGRSHFFRIYRMPMYLYAGYPCFYYGGYWISLLDPWPQYWPADWYANDDVYIDYYGDGYYLFNPRYPGVRIAVVIYLTLP